MRRLVALALAAAAISVVTVACGRPAPTEPSVTIIQRASPPIPAPAPTVAPGEEAVTERLIGTPLTVQLVDNGGAGPFSYDPQDLTFDTGEIVNFTFFSEAAFHTFTVGDLDINVEVNAGESGGLDFAFEEPGTYVLICVPHEALGMVGTITVR